MSSSCLLSLLLVLPGPGVPAFGPRSPGPPFQEERASDAALVKLQGFLEEKPYHAAAFERMVHEATALGRLADLERAYAERLERDGDDRVARVVLARLCARSRRGSEALELLAGVPEESAELLHLRGRLLIANGELEAGAEVLDRAAALPAGELERGEILTLAGRTWARLGRPEPARASLHALVEGDPESFTLRLEVAALFEESGLPALAREELEQAARLARGDPERTVRAEVALGRLQERLGNVALAEEAYARAAARMRADHWLSRELLERRLALHRADGSLEELVETFRRAVEAAPSDEGARRSLAETLTAIGRTEEGLEVLGEATRAFPGSLELGREHAQLLAASGRAEEAVLEYERIAGLDETAVWPYLEAGTLLAALEDKRSALGHWRAALARQPKSVELRIELARVEEHFGLASEGDALLLEAIELAPGDLRPVRALADAWRERGVSGRVQPLVTRIQEDAVRRGDAGSLEELAFLWAELEEEPRAVRALEDALAAGGDRERLSRTLAALLEETGPFRRLAEVLEELLELASTPDERFELSGRIAGAYAGAHRTQALTLESERRLRDHPDDLGARLLLARGSAAGGREAGALEVLEDLRDGGEHVEDALLHLAWLLTEEGRVDEAIASLRDLLELRRGDRLVLERIARLEERAGHEEALAEVQEELLRSNPTDRQLLTDLAEAAAKKNDDARAIELLSRVVELYPGDDGARLALGSAFVRQDRADDAREAIARVARSPDAALRAKARKRFRELLGDSAAAQLEIERLRERMLAEPARFELGIIAAHLAIEEFAFDEAQTIADELLLRHPRDPAVLELREHLRGLTLAGASAPFDAETALRGTEDVEASDLELVRLLVAQGEGMRARRIVMRLDAPIVAANLLLACGEPEEARRLLRPLCRRDSRDPELWVRLSVAYQAEGRESWALRALDEAIEAAGEPWALLLAKARLDAGRGYRHGVRADGEALLASLDRSREAAASIPEGRELHRRRVEEAARFFDEHRIDFLAAGERALAAYPQDMELLAAVLARAGPRDARRARALIAGAVESGPPPWWSTDEWRLAIAEHRERFPARSRRGLRSRGD